jgi:chromosomal replication initiation ATPase DnaA
MTTDKLTLLYSKSKGEISKLINNLEDFSADMKRIADYHKIPVEYIFLQCRNREICDARQCLTALVRKRYDLHQTGRLMGGYDHTTVINSCRSVSNRYDTDYDFRMFFDTLNHYKKEQKKKLHKIETATFPLTTALGLKSLSA